jgi:Na+/H+ antiporter NhaD/arsenite permease-like protein
MTQTLPTLFGIPIDFILFALTLAGVALFHHHTLRVAVIGLATITLYKLVFTGFAGGPGIAGLLGHLRHEWVIVANLFGLLLGFALLSRHFEDSRVPAILPRFLPDDWKGGFVMLVLVFVLSSFLDNIAAAMIGGSMAAVLYRRRVHIGFLAAIVAASNAGGSGSVVGDTTTTMMWIDGVNPLNVLDAYIAAVPALLFFGVIAARQQQAYQPISKDAPRGITVEWTRVGIVAFILVSAIVANVYFNLQHPEVLEHFPVLGVAVWVAVLLTAFLRKPEWSLLPDATRGSIFLLSLVLCASMMPVERLPLASWQSTFGLGFISAVFDNIPLTALALHQGGYDWGTLAYAVGFGGSMIWFGSSAGVALASSYPEARSVGAWLKGGWHVAVGYVLGFFVLHAVLGWHPEATHKTLPRGAPSAAAPLEPAPLPSLEQGKRAQP